jgi:hypothetical protein
MKRTKIFLVAALMIGMGGALATTANNAKKTTYYYDPGTGCVSTTIAPPCPGAASVICKIMGVTYYGTNLNCGTALLYTAP